MIKKLKAKMYKYIDKYGINSNKTISISQKLDTEIIKYYENSSMKYFYDASKQGLLDYFNDYNSLPDTSNWNMYAKDNNYLSAESIQYMSGISFDLWCSLVTKNPDK